MSLAGIHSTVTPNNSDLTELRPPFIDVSNVINAYTLASGNVSYTATQDCVLVGYTSQASGGSITIYLDDVYIMQYSTSGGGVSVRDTVYLPIKKGQKIAWTVSGTTQTLYLSFVIYGLL